MAYIETEMAKRHRHQMPANTTDSNTSTTSQASSDGLSTTVALQREPASLGKLHEIDLGQEAKLQNIARTEAATRRLAGDDRDVLPAHEDSTSSISTSGKDGRRGAIGNGETARTSRGTGWWKRSCVKANVCRVLELQSLSGLAAHC